MGNVDKMSVPLCEQDLISAPMFGRLYPHDYSFHRPVNTSWLVCNHARWGACRVFGVRRTGAALSRMVPRAGGRAGGAWNRAIRPRCNRGWNRPRLVLWHSSRPCRRAGASPSRWRSGVGSPFLVGHCRLAAKRGAEWPHRRRWRRQEGVRMAGHARLRRRPLAKVRRAAPGRVRRFRRRNRQPWLSGRILPGCRAPCLRPARPVAKNRAGGPNGARCRQGFHGMPFSRRSRPRSGISASGRDATSLTSHAMGNHH